MNSVSPILPDNGDNELRIAEHQPEYTTIAAIPVRVEEGIAILTRWTFTEEERQRIAAGEDLILEVLGQMVPVRLYVANNEDIREIVQGAPPTTLRVVSNLVS